MARGKKLARRNEEASGLEDSNDGVFSATSPPESLQIEQAVVQEAPSTQQDSEQIASSHQTPSTEQTLTTQQAPSATPDEEEEDLNKANIIVIRTRRIRNPLNLTHQVRLILGRYHSFII
ncbi:hypothetical protein ACLB2K_064691 [Fragaria x ananassa]